jgi:prevent-host-death family protein
MISAGAAMTTIYSMYEAKARFGEILRRACAGQRVVIADRGKPVAEVRPIQPREVSLAGRFKGMEEEGLLSRPAKPARRFTPIARRPGALRRFLDSRG